jgi:hypothetical protein
MSRALHAHTDALIGLAIADGGNASQRRELRHRRRIGDARRQCRSRPGARDQARSSASGAASLFYMQRKVFRDAPSYHSSMNHGFADVPARTE